MHRDDGGLCGCSGWPVQHNKGHHPRCEHYVEMMRGFVVTCGESRLSGTYWPDPGATQHDDSWSRPYRQRDGPGTLEFFSDWGGSWHLTESYGGPAGKFYVAKVTQSSTPPLAGWEVWRGAGAGSDDIPLPAPSLLATG